MSEENQNEEAQPDLREAFREVGPLLDQLDGLLKPLGLEAAIVPKKKAKGRPAMRVNGGSDNGDPQPLSPRGRKAQHHQVAYWKKIKKIMNEEGCDVEAARKIYTQRKDAA